MSSPSFPRRPAWAALLLLGLAACAPGGPDPAAPGMDEPGPGMDDPDLLRTGALPEDLPITNPPPKSGATLPPRYDLSAGMPPVRSQGQVGSCTAFAVAGGALAYELGARYGAYGWSFGRSENLPSPRFVYLSTPQDGQGCPDDGRYLGHVAQWVVDNGAATERSAPYYSDGDFDCAPSFVDAARNEAPLLRPARTIPINLSAQDGLTAAKELIANGKHPLAFGLAVDKAFKKYDGGVWTYRGPSVGGHAMVIVGYDDDLSAFRVRNSWGSDWGERGYGWISYDTFNGGGSGQFPAIYGYAFETRFNLETAQRFVLGLPGIRPPRNVQASDAYYPDRVEVSWEAETDATGYRVLRDGAPVGTVGKVTSFSDPAPDLQPHRYAVVALAWFERTRETLETAPSAADEGSRGSDPTIREITPRGGASGSYATFSADVIGTGPFQYAWDFGGGAAPATSTAASPTVTLAAAGTYKAKLTVQSARGTVELPFDLVVDFPASTWRHSFGGNGRDVGNAVAVDGTGATYVVGQTSSFGKGGDALILKYDAGGNLVFARTFGGDLAEEARGVALSRDGKSVYVVGRTYSFGAGQSDIFVLKLDSAGNRVWTQIFGERGYDHGRAVAVDDNENVYVVGSWADASSNLLLTKLSSAGVVQWQQVLMGSGFETGDSVAVARDGSAVYVAGTTDSWGAGDTDFLVAAFRGDGAFSWSRVIGFSTRQASPTVALGPDGNLYLAGESEFTGTAKTATFLCSYTATGDLRWQRSAAAGGEHSRGAALAIDALGNLHLVHRAESDFDPSFTVLSRIDLGGNLKWSRRFNDAGSRVQVAAAVSSVTGKLHLAGIAADAASYAPVAFGLDYAAESAGEVRNVGNVGPIRLSMLGGAPGSFTPVVGNLDTGSGGTDEVLTVLYAP